MFWGSIAWVISTSTARGSLVSITPFITAAYASSVPKSVSSVIGGAMERLHQGHGKHGHDDEDHRKDYGEAKESPLDASPGAVDTVRLPENAAEAATLNLKQNGSNQGDRYQHLSYREIDGHSLSSLRSRSCSSHQRVRRANLSAGFL
jgi:hypothetical protein